MFAALRSSGVASRLYAAAAATASVGGAYAFSGERTACMESAASSQPSSSQVSAIPPAGAHKYAMQSVVARVGDP